MRGGDDVAVLLDRRLGGALASPAPPAEPRTRRADVARNRGPGRHRVCAGLASRARLLGGTAEPQTDPVARRRGRPPPGRPAFAAAPPDRPARRPAYDGGDERIRRLAGAAPAPPRPRLPRPTGKKGVARARSEERRRPAGRHPRPW